jgi:hypothetical protein
MLAIGGGSGARIRLANDGLRLKGLCIASNEGA